MLIEFTETLSIRFLFAQFSSSTFTKVNVKETGPKLFCFVTNGSCLRIMVWIIYSTTNVLILYSDVLSLTPSS